MVVQESPRYKYIIPAIDGKPLVDIPDELRLNTVSSIYGTDEISILSNVLVDRMLYDENVRVIDLVNGVEISNIFEYKHPGIEIKVVKDEDKVYSFIPSNNYKGYKILDYGNPGTDISNPGDDYKVIQNTINILKNIGGGVIRLKGDFYITEKLNIDYPTQELDVDFMFVGSRARIYSDINDVFYIHTSPGMFNYPVFSNLKIYGISDNKGGCGFHIVDSYHTSIYNCLIKNKNIGILMEINDYWTESTLIADCKIGYIKDSAIKCVTNSTEHTSFDQTRIIRCDITIDDKIGLYVGTNSHLYRSAIDFVCWSNNGTILYVDGNIGHCDTFIKADGTGKILDIGENADSGIVLTCIYPLGSFTVNNPYSKAYTIFIDKTDMVISSTFNNKILNLYNPDGTILFELDRASDGHIVFGTHGTFIGFWDFENNTNAEVKLGPLTCLSLVNKNILSSDYGGNFRNFTEPTAIQGKLFVAQDTNTDIPATRLYLSPDGTNWNYALISQSVPFQQKKISLSVTPGNGEFGTPAKVVYPYIVALADMKIAYNDVAAGDTVTFEISFIYTDGATSTTPADISVSNSGTTSISGTKSVSLLNDLAVAIDDGKSVSGIQVAAKSADGTTTVSQTVSTIVPVFM